MVKVDEAKKYSHMIFYAWMLLVKILKKMISLVFSQKNCFKIWEKQKSLAQGGERTSRLSQVPTGEYDYSPGRLNTMD